MNVFNCIAIVGVSIGLKAQTGRECKKNPDLVGTCFSLHGRVMYTNGAPSLRIWIVGTNRILGVLLPEDEIIPPNLKRALKGWDTWVYADLEVYPFTKEKPGEMQVVCVESVEHLVVTKLTDRPPPP